MLGSCRQLFTQQAVTHLAPTREPGWDGREAAALAGPEFPVGSAGAQQPASGPLFLGRKAKSLLVLPEPRGVLSFQSGANELPPPIPYLVLEVSQSLPWGWGTLRKGKVGSTAVCSLLFCLLDG